MRNKMQKILLGIGLFLLTGIVLTFLFVHGKLYQSKHFIVFSNMPQIFKKLILTQSEVYYQGVTPKYFSKGFDKQLKIYYKKTASKSDKEFGFYEEYIPAVFTSRERYDGTISGWGTLFHEISHHFVQINYGNTPKWFSEGLAAFLGEPSRIINGKLIIGFPNPWREQLLRNGIESEGEDIDISRLIAMSDSEFDKWDIACHVARDFFYWLYSRGKLVDFLTKVKDQWSGVETLENIFSEKIDTLNQQFIAFIKNDCYAGAYVKDGQDTDDVLRKKEAYTKALSLKPDYDMAKFLLAQEVYEKTDIIRAKALLSDILINKESTWFMSAAFELGLIYYDNENNFTKALEYLQLAWDYSDYDEYRYEIAYNLGCCYLYLGDRDNAKKWFKNYIKYNYAPEQDAKNFEFAESFLHDRHAYLNEDKLHYNQGCKYAKEGEFDKAIDEYKASITINPNFSDAYYNLACAYARSHKSAEAIQNLKRAIKLKGEQRKSAGKDEAFANIRNEKEFQELVKKKGD